MSNPLDDRKKALEEDYFHRKERELIEKMRARMDEEKRASAALQCPKCDGKLVEVAFEDVQIDVCDKCGGAWLDAGELESLTKKEGGSGWFGRLLGGSSGD